MIDDYYSLLGVGRKATKEQIRKAYRRLVLRTHPDRNPGKPEAEEVFKRLTGAYEVLSNDEKRTLYDRKLTSVEDAFAEFRKKTPPVKKETPLPRQKSRLSYGNYQNRFSDTARLRMRDWYLGAGCGAALYVIFFLMDPSAGLSTTGALYALAIGASVFGLHFFCELFEGLFEGFGFALSDSITFGEFVSKLSTILLSAAGGVFLLPVFFRPGTVDARPLLPVIVAAGIGTWVGSGVGRAFCSVAESRKGTLFGMAIAASAAGATALLISLLLGSLFIANSFVESSNLLIATGGGALFGSALAAAWGSLAFDRETT